MQVRTAADQAEREKSVVEWLCAELADPEITADDNFLDVGGHSLTFVRLNRHLEDTFGLVLDQKLTYSEPLRAAVAAMQPSPGGHADK